MVSSTTFLIAPVSSHSHGRRSDLGEKGRLKLDRREPKEGGWGKERRIKKICERKRSKKKSWQLARKERNEKKISQRLPYLGAAILRLKECRVAALQ